MEYITFGNGKLSKTAKKHDCLIGTFSIKPVITCPGAAECKKICYGLTGNYRCPSVKNAIDEKYALSMSDAFIPVIDWELKRILVKNPDKPIFVRIHDVGDFYSAEYVEKWFKIMVLNPKIKFYAYTKSIHLFKVYQTMPDNFRLIYSMHGLYDFLIDTDIDAHARVFESVDELTASGYTDCSDDDLLIYTTDKIGLVYHGTKKFKKTGFNKN